jgi:hypothetical protein
MLCAQPARLVLCVRSRDLFRRRPVLQSPGSRCGVAPCRLGEPLAAPFSPALPRGCHRPSGPGFVPPLRPLATAPVRPGGAPSLPPGQAGPPLRGDRSVLRHFVLFLCPALADLISFGLPVLGRCGRLRDCINPRTLRTAAFVWCSGPSADRRCALTALALRSFNSLPASGATSLRSDALVRRRLLRDREPNHDRRNRATS